MRPSGNCVVFHRGDAAGGGDAPGAANRAELSAVRGRNPVIIIIATEAVAQLTTGDPVQNAADMLPLTSSAILMRLPVGVMF